MVLVSKLVNYETDIQYQLFDSFEASFWRAEFLQKKNLKKPAIWRKLVWTGFQILVR